MIFKYIIIGIALALLIGNIFPRKLAIPIGLWGYTEYFVAGDNSPEGT